MLNLKGHVMKGPWYKFNGSCLDGLRKRTQNLSEGFPGQDLNP
jgi:hypothetical protein